MALVSVSDAAKMVGKSRAALYRDLEKGVLAKTVLQDGDIRIDTAELVRAYGPLPRDEAKEEAAPAKAVAAPKKTEAAPKKLPVRPSDKVKIALQEERIKALERVVALEAELRRVKDQVTNELRARLAEKDNLIKTLESKILFLEYDKQVEDVPTLRAEDGLDEDSLLRRQTGRSRERRWWKKLIRKNEGARAK